MYVLWYPWRQLFTCIMTSSTLEAHPRVKVKPSIPSSRSLLSLVASQFPRTCGWYTITNVSLSSAMPLAMMGWSLQVSSCMWAENLAHWYSRIFDQDAPSNLQHPFHGVEDPQSEETPRYFLYRHITISGLNRRPQTHPMRELRTYFVSASINVYLTAPPHPRLTSLLYNSPCPQISWYQVRPLPCPCYFPWMYLNVDCALSGLECCKSYSIKAVCNLKRTS